jgi:shikimate kinase
MDAVFSKEERERLEREIVYLKAQVEYWKELLRKTETVLLLGLKK